MLQKKLFHLFLIFTIVVSMVNIPISASAVAGSDLDCQGGNVFTNPSKVAVDNNNNLYVQDTAHDGTISIMKKNASSGEITTLISGLNPTNFKSFAVSPSGEVYLVQWSISNSYQTEVTKLASNEAPIIINDTITSIGIDAEGNIYYPTTSQGAFEKRSTNGQTSMIDEINSAFLINNDVQGNVYTISYGYDNSTYDTMIQYSKIPANGGPIVTKNFGDEIEPVDIAGDVNGHLIIVQGGGVYKYSFSANSLEIVQGESLANVISAAVDNVGNYYVIEKDGPLTQAVVKKISTDGVITILGETASPPVIQSGLDDKTVSEGSYIEFSLVAQSCNNDHTYQWYKDGEPISGETNANLIIDGVVISDSADYTVRVQDGSGYVEDTATLTVLSSDAYVSSNVYTVKDKEKSISNVPSGTSVLDFIENITADQKATLKVYESDGTTIKTGNIQSGDKLIVTAEDNTTTSVYTVKVMGAPSSNANLSNLALNIGTLSPQFLSSTTDYTVEVENYIGSIKVMPTLEDNDATITIDGEHAASGEESESIYLEIGDNTIPLVVTSTDGTEKTYTLTVKRASEYNAYYDASRRGMLTVNEIVNQLQENGATEIEVYHPDGLLQPLYVDIQDGYIAKYQFNSKEYSAIIRVKPSYDDYVLTYNGSGGPTIADVEETFLEYNFDEYFKTNYGFVYSGKKAIAAATDPTNGNLFFLKNSKVLSGYIIRVYDTQFGFSRDFKLVINNSSTTPSIPDNPGTNPPGDGNSGSGGSNGGGSSTPPSNNEGNDDSANSNEPTQETITVPVETGQVNKGTIVLQTPITRTTDSNGKVSDDVALSLDRAKETVKLVKELGQNTARIVIPDEKDKVSRVNVNVPKEATKEVKENNISLEIYTENVRIAIPQQSLNTFEDDLYFRLIPLKEEAERKEVEERAKKEEIIQQVAKNQTVQVLGRPMEIETNMQNREVSLVLPLKDSLPTDAKERQKVLDNLGVYIEHSDGTKELLRGKVVNYKDETELGLEFTVNKFSTFTIIYMDGAEAFFDEEACGKDNAIGCVTAKKTVPVYELVNNRLKKIDAMKAGQSAPAYEAISPMLGLGGDIWAERTNAIRYETPSKAMLVKNAATGSKRVKQIWKGLELRPGQIGKITVLQDTVIWEKINKTKKLPRILKKGEQYRVYRYVPGMYDLGNGKYVVQDEYVTLKSF